MNDLVLQQRANLYEGDDVTVEITGSKAIVHGASGGSGGVVYSDVEHVVGTWIDGRPLYEITKQLYINGVFNDTDWHANGNERFAVGVVGELVDCRLFNYRQYETETTNYMSVGADDTCLFCGLVNKTTHEVGCYFQTSQGAVNTYVTFRYYKNSDII